MDYNLSLMDKLVNTLQCFKTIIIMGLFNIIPIIFLKYNISQRKAKEISESILGSENDKEKKKNKRKEKSKEKDTCS